jgi:4'-phosphopantetheinyl transferase EntD
MAIFLWGLVCINESCVRRNKAARHLEARLLTDEERASLGKVASIPHEEDVLLRFSFKEAAYKAIHPYLKRFVAFTEVEAFPNDDGTATINFLLLNGEAPFTYQASWRKFEDK